MTLKVKKNEEENQKMTSIGRKGRTKKGRKANMNNYE